jgi:hypothetical protein
VKQAIEYIAVAWDNVSISTIKNCWRHTYILPTVGEDIVDAVDSRTNEHDDVEIIDNLPDQHRMIAENCIRLLDAPVTTEEILSDEQIVSLVNTEDGESSDESDEEIPRVQLKEAKCGLETAIRYFEQQADGVGIDFNDLRIFRKYLNLLSLEELELKRQQKIDNYFTKQL